MIPSDQVLPGLRQMEAILKELRQVIQDNADPRNKADEAFAGHVVVAGTAVANMLRQIERADSAGAAPAYETRVEIPAVNWHMALATAVREAGPDTVIVVDSEAKKQLAVTAATRMGKTVTVEINPRS